MEILEQWKEVMKQEEPMISVIAIVDMFSCRTSYSAYFLTKGQSKRQDNEWRNLFLFFFRSNKLVIGIGFKSWEFIVWFYRIILRVCWKHKFIKRNPIKYSQKIISENSDTLFDFKYQRPGYIWRCLKYDFDLHFLIRNFNNITNLIIL